MIWELRDNFSPYDAAYVALAELLGIELLTTDGSLGRAVRAFAEIDLAAAR